MKAREAVAQIVQSAEHRELVEYRNLVQDDPESLTPNIQEHIDKLFSDLDEKVTTEAEDFLRRLTASYRSKNAPVNRINYGAVKNTKAAAGAFFKQVKEQMPIYWQMLLKEESAVAV